jgi:hypothetical protein
MLAPSGGFAGCAETGTEMARTANTATPLKNRFILLLPLEWGRNFLHK